MERLPESSGTFSLFNNEILASELTTNEVGDLSMVRPLLDQIPGDLASVLADGAYDGEPAYRAIAEHQPRMVAIEDVFYAVNVKSALKLGQVRGVAMLAASSCGLEVAEYSPLSIKSSVVGYGRAEKHQVQQMVMRLLGLTVPPEPMDASDALAIAICHIHTASTLKRYQVSSR